MSMQFQGVMPATTTPFAEDGTIDHGFAARHAQWLIEHGATGIIALGSLGEGATLSRDEKLALCKTLVEAGRPTQTPVVAAISALSTEEAAALARGAQQVGCRGLMVLPPYVHKGPWAEIRAHFEAVIEATELPCMLYNNPIAYGTDLLPEQIAELAGAHERVVAVKESSGDLRRVTAVRALLGERLRLFAGLDDMAFEAGSIGADGWVAGLVNALPAESIAVFELARSPSAAHRAQAAAIYHWFLPLLRLDCVPDFVQRIKLVQAEVDMGNERVRAPRAPLSGSERERTLALVREHLGRRPAVPTAAEIRTMIAEVSA
ncbi:dihydrodipicolinate synthase family protein [Plesiocystis pacifica SIR-1]|uniref:Dihydrodipicolinate synthase family protein n=1 Tax=Plesiocystis pacifica SIR-1 TaxID=391625 RepID=A6GJN0_9BACT|nr:dihydrodipicolinate synthase family protein [Plesiocystis pacifica SIR-1]